MAMKAKMTTATRGSSMAYLCRDLMEQVISRIGRFR